MKTHYVFVKSQIKYQKILFLSEKFNVFFIQLLHIRYKIFEISSALGSLSRTSTAEEIYAARSVSSSSNTAVTITL